MAKKKEVKKKDREYKYTTGRPTVMTESTVNKLLIAFANSFTDQEACLYANISKQTLYDYCKKFPEFSDQKEELKKKPNLKAKMNWLEKINNKDYQASKEWLQAKSKDEFSTKKELENKVEVQDNTLSEEQKEKVEKLLKMNNM